MKCIVLIILLITTNISFSRSDTLCFDRTSRYVICLIPSKADNIYGIAIGLIGSETICNRPYTKYSHGINLQLFGQGFLQTFYINKINFTEIYYSDSIVMNEKVLDSLTYRAIHNGILISSLGTFTEKVNGISISGWMSMGREINGVSFNLLWNLYEKINGLSLGLFNSVTFTNGLQIGIVNKSKKINGIQVGLWNTNEKRSLPLLNWGFPNKKLHTR
jgi:hypothetical protein